MPDRYDASGNPEGRYQPGSDGQVVLNKPGICTVDEMDCAEFDALLEFQSRLFDVFPIDKQITTDDLCAWHRDWLGSIYDWAGNYRSVNMSKGNFAFAASRLIHGLMSDFDQNLLAELTPCVDMDRGELIDAIARCHVEFILIHPFREGNGRLGRVLSTVMALQADMPVLDFEIIERDKDRYIAAIHAGLARDYAPMKLIFSDVLENSLERASRRRE